MRFYSRNMDSRMFDFREYYDTIADLLPESSVIAEVGLGDGASAIFLAEALLNRGKTFKFYLIDSLAYGGPDQLCTIVNHLGRAGLLEFVEVIPVDSLNASTRFPDFHFHFVFIDASHRYELTKADIRLWYSKIKRKGVFAGHDYNETPEGIEVKQAVDEVIPKDWLHCETTEKGYGVWWIQKQQSDLYERDVAEC